MKKIDIYEGDISKFKKKKEELMKMLIEEVDRDIRNKYNGLRNTNCGCGIDDLMPCESYSGSCVPAYLSVVGEECRSCAMFEFCTRQYYSEIKNDDRGRVCKEEML